MSISAVNSVNFSGKRDNIDAFINLDDNAIRHVAMAKTRQNVDFDAHKKRNAALLLSLPVAEGLATAAALKKGARLKGFVTGTGVGALFWGGMLGTLGLMSLIERKNDKVGNFVEKHPVLSFIGSAFAAYFAGKGLAEGGAKLYKYVRGTKGYANVAAKAAEIFEKAKGNKYVGKGLEKLAAARKYVNTHVSKLPSALKETFKTLASLAPITAIIGTLVESVNFRKAVSNEYAHNYTELKNKQLEYARQRNAEMNV